MRLTKGKILLATAIVLGGAIAFLGIHSSGKPTLRLTDGTVLTVARVAYGEREPFTLRPWQNLLQKIADQLPTWLGRHLPAVPNSPGMWEGGQLPVLGGDALYVWLTRRDPRSGKFVGTGLYWAQILDEHGCPFHCAQAGGITYNPRPTTVGDHEVAWFAFQAFPRRQKRFRLRVYGGAQNIVGEIWVANPAPRRAANWEIEPLPTSKRDGNLIITLQSLSFHIHTNETGTEPERLQAPPLISPRFEVREEGRVTTEWEAVQMELSDSLGNSPARWFFKSPFLCPFEPAWRLRLKFCAGNASRSASNVCWTLRHLKLPAPGSFIALPATQQLQGVTLRLMGIAGAGRTTYSNEVPVQAQLRSGLEGRDYELTSSSAGTSGRIITHDDVQMAVPHVALSVSGLGEDQRLSAQAIDDKGRNYFAKVWEWDFRSGGFKEIGSHYFRLNDSSRYFLGLDVPADGGEFDLVFCVHRARTVEFVVRPPGAAP